MKLTIPRIKPFAHTFFSPIFIMFSIIPIIVYYYIVIHFSINIPVMDDYDSILAYLNKSDYLSFDNLLSQHNEHRIVWTRLVAAGYYAIFGKINLVHLMFIGNLAVLLIFCLLLKIMNDRQLPSILLVPVAYMLFNSLSWSNITWAMAILGNYYCMFFALLTFFLWNKRTLWGYGLGLIAGTLTSYTNANGLIVFFVLLLWEGTGLFTWFQDRVIKKGGELLKQPIRIWVLLIVILCQCYAYFRGYNFPAAHQGLDNVLLKYPLLIPYAFQVIGSYAFVIGKIAMFLIGGVELLFILFITYRKYYQKNSTLYWFLIFSMLSIFAIASGRFGLDIDQAVPSRYRFFAVIVLILIYLAFIELYTQLLVSRTWVICFLIVLSIGFNIGSNIIGIQGLSTRKSILTEGIRTWDQSGEGLDYPDQVRASSVLRESMEKRIYQLPDF